MPKVSAPVYFDLDGFHVRTARDWADSNTSPREHAIKHGFAGSWKANGAYVTCTRLPGGALRRVSFPDGRPKSRTGRYAPASERKAS